MKYLLPVLVLTAVAASAQTTTTPTTPTINFVGLGSPVGFAGYGSYNQVGTPQLTGGVALFYQLGAATAGSTVPPRSTYLP